MLLSRLTPIVAFAAVVTVAAPAAAFDATGTWTGKRTCKNLVSGTKVKNKQDLLNVVTNWFDEVRRRAPSSR